MVALQNIIPSVQHIAQRYASETTGNWFDKDDVQNTYNNAAWPSGQNNIGPVQGRSSVFSFKQPSSVSGFGIELLPFWGATTGSELAKADIDIIASLGLLQDVNSIDWTLQESRKPSKKRAMADYSITINCQPELMKSSLKKFEDYRVGLYFDSTLKVFVENTEAMNTCMNNDAPDTTPFILVQKGPSIPQPSYTIYICPAAKWLFKPQFAAYHFVQNTLLSATSATLWQEFQQKTNWNLGPSWSINNFVWLDSMILAALMAIGQGQDSAIIHGYTTDVWTHCFKTQGANWGDPSESCVPSQT